MAHHDFVRLKSSELIVALPAVEALSAWIAGSRSASTKLKHLGHADELLGLMHTCMLNFPDHQVVQNLLINVLLTFVQANKGICSVFLMFQRSDSNPQMPCLLQILFGLSSRLECFQYYLIHSTYF
jgi:hypothetical protein